VPAILLGGARTATGDRCDHVTAADLGRTILACLGLPEAERLDHRRIGPTERGRLLGGICPPSTPAASPSPVTVP
jgi:hypothetical protein